MLVDVITAMVFGTMFLTAPRNADALERLIPPVEIVEVIEIKDPETYVKTYFRDEVMHRIAECESGFTQFDENGKPLKNPSSTATGIFQIMKSLHGREAKEMGFDINTLEGNVKYAEYLYKKNGTKDWIASADCWSPTESG